jgi:hypothetical protein
MATPERQFSPEERASFLGWRFGSTLDWASIILTEIGYPVEENRWFVDAVCGIYQRTKAHYKDQGVPIPHGALAKRAQRFKNKSQASDLVRSAIERDAEWSRLKRMMIFDVERPKPHERCGKDKRAATKYTDYLTPAAVRFTDPEEVAAEVDEKLGTAVGESSPAGWLQDSLFSYKKGKVGLTLLVEDNNLLSGASQSRSNGREGHSGFTPGARARDPSSSSSPSNGSNTIKGSREVPR